MLDKLSSELLARVLRHLLPQPHDAAAFRRCYVRCGAEMGPLHAARLVCRASAAAAREHLAAAVTLTPRNTRRSRATPDWPRFPGLRVVRVEGWNPKTAPVVLPRDAEQLLGACFGYAPADAGAPLKGFDPGHLSRVTVLKVVRSDIFVDHLASALARLPALKAVTIIGGVRSASKVCRALSGATGLERLALPDVPADAALCAAAGLDGLSRLEALTLGQLNLEVGSLPGGLTAVAFRRQFEIGYHQPVCAWPALFDAASRLVELRGVHLELDTAAALARSAPRLRVLVCTPMGALWAPPRAGPWPCVFPCITHACFFSRYEAAAADIRAAPLPAMLPALEQLASTDVHPYPSFVGLTGLRALSLSDVEFDPFDVEAVQWDALGALPRLTEMDVYLDPRDPVQLAGLVRLTNLEVLKVTVMAFARSDEVHIDMGAVMEAVACLPLLHTVQIKVQQFENGNCMVKWGLSGLRRFAHGAPALHYLSIQVNEWGGVPAPVVGALAMHTGLRRLLVDCSHEEPSAVDALAAEVSAECNSLTIEPYSSSCLVQVCAWREGAWED
ncbi:hypothetical protein MNEG_13081 [Monoraphidium neglectum]|uniref:Uncharacterized protein n=1 Tax=Monoraphidium neglectum TaxID=145388 RepID=A0A0D2J4L2_9CHLO|nr:hypothetical protein MNEG_13081 [Monoraphidium neglectum]KIY94882.1 hypothetical protein MNEG_13081 [Monoraphidium neglectum]|eukprot:XP_013893902.1 hypothetical protein MNEG_13081 [Monoraphidium neglectum]